MAVTTTTALTTPQPDDTTLDLHLLSVLESELPVEIGTADQPDRYTVPAVFSRQVTRTERARIEDPATAQALAAQLAVAPAGPRPRAAHRELGACRASGGPGRRGTRACRGDARGRRDDPVRVATADTRAL